MPYPERSPILQADNPPTWKIKLLYDGACPLCVREVNFLKSKDRGWIAFVDIAADDYNPKDNAGIDFETAMGRIHALLPNGEIIQNVEVFRQTYEILGIGWIYAVTKLPLFGRLADGLYGVWADYRLFLTGRADLKTIIAERKKRIMQNNQNSAGLCSDVCANAGTLTIAERKSS
jgi:predicted DCC family thiol-disulfide oxidoreductase YuxK